MSQRRSQSPKGSVIDQAVANAAKNPLLDKEFDDIISNKTIYSVQSKSMHRKQESPEKSHREYKAHTEILQLDELITREKPLTPKRSSSPKPVVKFSNRGDIVKKSIMGERSGSKKKNKNKDLNEETKYDLVDKDENSKNIERKSSDESKEVDITPSKQEKKKKQKSKSKKTKTNKKKKKYYNSDDEEEKLDSGDNEEESGKKSLGKRGSKTSRDGDKKKKRR